MGCHGVMLGLQLLKAHKCSRAFYRAMTTKFNDLYEDFKCLHQLHTKLQLSKVKNFLYVLTTKFIFTLQELDSSAEIQNIFPFVMMNGSDTFEQKKYDEISVALTELHKLPTKRRNIDILLKLADKW